MPTPRRRSTLQDRWQDRWQSCWHARRRSAAGDAGAGTVEYLGGIVFVGLLILSLLMIATPVGGTIAARLCEAVGASCPAGSVTVQDAPKRAPDRPCTVRADKGKVEVGVDVAFVKLGTGGEMGVERLSDGTYKITVDGELGAAVAATTGEVQGKLEIGDYGSALGLGADASVGAEVGAGVEYTFPDQASAERFVSHVQRELAVSGVTGVASGLSPLGPGVGIDSRAVGWLVDRITGYDYRPPGPAASYFQGGFTGGATATAGGLVGGGNASAEMAEVLGLKLDHGTGDRTIYSKVTIDAETAVQLGLSSSDAAWGSGASGKGTMEMVVATTVSSDLEVSAVSFDGVATAEGSYALTQIAGHPVQDSGGRGVRLSAQFPVTDANRPRVLRALAGLGSVAAASGPAGPVMARSAAIPLIMQEARTNGDVTAEFLDVNSSNLLTFALALKAPAIGGLGLGMKSGLAEQTTTDARFLGDHGWEDWTACA